MSEKEEFVWVTGARNRPVHNNAIFKGDYYDISITQEMVDNNVPVKMPNTTNFMDFVRQGIVKVEPDAKDAEKRYEAWDAKRKGLAKKIMAEKVEDAALVKEAVKAAEEVVKTRRRKPVGKEVKE